MMVMPEVYYKVVDGMEGDEITVTSSDYTKARYVCYRVNEKGVVATSEGADLESSLCHIIILPDNILIGERLLIFLILDNHEFGTWPNSWIKTYLD